MMATQPKVIFFDAVGTLFGVKDGVGATYAKIAQRHGVTADSERLEQGFRQSFKRKPAPAFPNIDAELIPKQEFLWWEAIAQETFTAAGVIEQFPDFRAFFTDLYQHFATAEPWFIFSETLASVQTWHAQGIELGLISNFDSRLLQVLDALELAPYFQSVTISSLTGAAKPNPKIFQTALAKHRCQPEEALHIGDSRLEDYEAAKRLGMQAYLIERDQPFPYSRQP
ncbi:HAD family hydrolase [Picosynechococcus sp. PCC 11901]|uniref:HAD-IA family hydrolase n=1 Tax=Picosynechococcus sp. PCC 11901 TaxID=2579791 RepID=UPI0010FC1FFB|nr:HAD-IA family hydrolase [Picosynechococcus sp. PCC 11901]QCS50603.1 HAD family hydrolase [Picosynechococcus sp. PCC 11901]